MKPSSVHLSRPVDSPTLALLDAVTAAAAGLDVSILLIGAFARDVIFEHVHGVLTERATGDVDVAVLAKTWQQYAELQTALLGVGFARHPNQAQRLVHCTGLVTDVIPCGEVAAADGHIRWPEDGALMSVVGFAQHDGGELPGIDGGLSPDLRKLRTGTRKLNAGRFAGPAAPVTAPGRRGAGRPARERRVLRSGC